MSADQRGHRIGVALDVSTKSSMKDRAAAAKQLEDSVLTKAIRARKKPVCFLIEGYGGCVFEVSVSY